MKNAQTQSEHLAFLKGFMEAWYKASETFKNDDWIDGANVLYLAYCELHNLPKLSACDLIFELNKI